MMWYDLSSFQGVRDSSQSNDSRWQRGRVIDGMDALSARGGMWSWPVALFTSILCIAVLTNSWLNKFDSCSLEYLTSAVDFQKKCTVGCPVFLLHF